MRACRVRRCVRRRLAENGLKPWRRDMWCIPKVDGEYVARMEDVLDLYAEAPDPGPAGGLLRREPGPTHRRGPPAETDMQRHFQVSPPSVHQMIVTLERNGLIRRQPGVARSIQILMPPKDLPILNWLGINQS